ncbi:MAG TPA: DUF4124 domain-containing protein [Burkholderiales bacterium]|nr:DUF4124 domain-containing protein [Burkholderiales bacterium]
MNITAKTILTAAAVCLGFAGPAQAQALKKYVTPDGKTVYSDRPIPGAKEVGEVAPPPKVTPADRSAAKSSAQRDAKDVKSAEQRIEERKASRERIAAAEAKLEAAKRALAEGKEPLPGERRGTAGGQSRLSDAYWQRQKANQQAVENAQRALDAARAAQ